MLEDFAVLIAARAFLKGGLNLPDPRDKHSTVKFPLLTLVVSSLLGLFAAAAAPTRVATLEDMHKVLAAAKVIEVKRDYPAYLRTDKTLVRYHLQITRPAELKQVAEFFRESQLSLNEELTRGFRAGDATVGSLDLSIVTIDGKFSFHIYASNHLVLADSLTYDGADTLEPLGNSFHNEFDFLIKRIQSSQAKAGKVRPKSKSR